MCSRPAYSDLTGVCGEGVHLISYAFAIIDLSGPPSPVGCAYRPLVSTAYLVAGWRHEVTLIRGSPHPAIAVAPTAYVTWLGPKSRVD